MKRRISYKKGYKYQLVKVAVFRDTGILGHNVSTDYINLTPGGVLIVNAGYAWDGASGAVDTANSMRGTVAHDALYQMLRQGHLPQGLRGVADDLLERCLTEDGMWRLRRWWWMRAVRNFAGGAANPANKKPVLTAP